MMNFVGCVILGMSVAVSIQGWIDYARHGVNAGVATLTTISGMLVLGGLLGAY